MSHSIRADVCYVCLYACVCVCLCDVCWGIYIYLANTLFAFYTHARTAHEGLLLFGPTGGVVRLVAVGMQRWTHAFNCVFIQHRNACTCMHLCVIVCVRVCMACDCGRAGWVVFSELVLLWTAGKCKKTEMERKDVTNIQNSARETQWVVFLSIFKIRDFGFGGRRSGRSSCRRSVSFSVEEPKWWKSFPNI